VSLFSPLSVILSHIAALQSTVSITLLPSALLSYSSTCANVPILTKIFSHQTFLPPPVPAQMSPSSPKYSPTRPSFHLQHLRKCPHPHQSILPPDLPSTSSTCANVPILTKVFSHILPSSYFSRLWPNIICLQVRHRTAIVTHTAHHHPGGRPLLNACKKLEPVSSL
jgi:hypothetical protein